MRILATLSTSLLLLAACSGGAESDAITEENTEAEPAGATVPETETTQEPQTVVAMPESFLGEWNISEEDCGTGLSEMTLTINANDVLYYESAASLTTITQSAPTAVTAIHSFSGEGETWEETLAYEINEAGDRLTVTQTDGSMSVRIRCP